MKKILASGGEGRIFAPDDGHHLSFQQIYKEHHTALLNNVLKFLSDQDNALDLVQDIFLKFWLLREEWQGIKDIKGYLYRLSRNLAIDYLRREKKYREVVQLYQSWNRPPNFDDEIVRREYYRLQSEVLSSLSPQQRRIYQLTQECGSKQGQIAKELGLSPLTIKTHLKMANRSMRNYLRPFIES